MMRFYWRRARPWLFELRRRLTEGITPRLLDRMGDAPRLDAGQRSWLLRDLREDLDDQIEDAEERGITERGARELVATHAMVEWLELGLIHSAYGLRMDAADHALNVHGLTTAVMIAAGLVLASSPVPRSFGGHGDFESGAS
jgi:hypothetical protein